MKYTIHTTQDITVVLVPMADSNSTTTQVFVKAGSVYESRETNGLSHFLEHLFFKGGKDYPTPHAVAQAVDAFGGEFNAYTSDHYASYYVKCAPEYTHKAIDVLSDMMVHARFPVEELEREKGVVLQEMKMIEDNPQRAVMSYWKEFFYGDNAFGRPIIGTADNVRRFSQQDLLDHQRNLYTKDNLIVVITGSRDNTDQLLDLIGSSFGDLPTHKRITKPSFERQRPKTQHAHRTMNTQQNHLVISAYGFPLSDDRRYAAKLLSIILGGSMSSRLFQRIREQLGVCYYISASHMSDIDDGVFVIRAGIDKEQFALATDKIFHEIDLIVHEGVTQEELTNAQGFLTGQTKMGIETSDDMADFVGESYLMRGTIQSLEDMLHHYQQVTVADIMAVAQHLQRSELFQYRVE